MSTSQGCWKYFQKNTIKKCEKCNVRLHDAIRSVNSITVRTCKKDRDKVHG